MFIVTLNFYTKDQTISDICKISRKTKSQQRDYKLLFESAQFFFWQILLLVFQKQNNKKVYVCGGLYISKHVLPRNDFLLPKNNSMQQVTKLNEPSKNIFWSDYFYSSTSFSFRSNIINNFVSICNKKLFSITIIFWIKTWK